jgi:putative transposase
MVDLALPNLPLVKQCRLLSIPRSTYYRSPKGESAANLALMRMIDVEYTKTPFYGSRRLSVILGRHGVVANRKRIQRLMRIMGLEAIYPKPRLSVRSKEHKIYPYLLRGMSITRRNHVWSTDFTYVPMQGGFMYLAAVIDWATRYVLSWQVSNTMDPDFCIEAAENALKVDRPEIFNTDQGSQFTCKAFLNVFEGTEVAISMDGRGRALDNVFVERLWRSVKYEDIYLKDYIAGWDLIEGMKRYFHFYNFERPHQALGYQTPGSLYFAKKS